MNIHLYCDTDEEGNITTVLAGENIVKNREYDYSFVVDSWEIVENAHLYKVIDGELVLSY
jgi:hypothetical protein